MNKLKKEVSEILSKAEKIVFVTGAGISKESGIPTFRGREGLWRKYDPMKLASIEAFENNPTLVWEWYQERRRNIRDAQPNEGHLSIASLAKKKNVFVLTQNIDGLHRKAGNLNIFELHGNIMRIFCTNCKHKDTILEDYNELPPKCSCGGLLRPDVVWFGEPLPKEVWEEAMIHASSCDLMFVVGTSLEVSPANLLPVLAKRNGAKLIEVNLEETIMSDEMDIYVQGSASEILPILLSDFNL